MYSVHKKKYSIHSNNPFNSKSLLTLYIYNIQAVKLYNDCIVEMYPILTSVTMYPILSGFDAFYAGLNTRWDYMNT